MKVIFLDIDGVLTTPPNYLFVEECVEYLKRIVEETGAKIVLSSSWRCGDPPNLEDTINRVFNYRSYKDGNIPEYLEWFIKNIYDVTHTYKNTRGEEIQDWIDDQFEKIENYVILDDRYDFKDSQLFHWVQSDYEYGLSNTDAIKAIKILNTKWFYDPSILNHRIYKFFMKEMEGISTEYSELNEKYNDLEKDFKNQYKR